MPDEPNTCCGATVCYVDGSWFYHLLPKFPGGQRAIFKVNFCPECGVHFLPNGEVEPRGEVVGRATLVYPIREGLLSMAGFDITMLVETFNGEVLLVRPAEEEQP